MHLRTYICAVLLIAAGGLTVTGAAQADHGHIIVLHQERGHCPHHRDIHATRHGHQRHALKSHRHQHRAHAKRQRHGATVHDRNYSYLDRHSSRKYGFGYTDHL